MKNKLISLVICGLYMISVSAQFNAPSGEESSKKSKKKPTIFQHLQVEKEIPKVVLTTDIKKILKEKYTLDFNPGTLAYTVDGKTQEWNIGIRARGKSRRKICYMPPLKVDFDEDQLKDRKVRKKHNTLKLVSYCKNQRTYENFVLREYLAYKLYNLVTDYSFQVQLVKIEYRDIEDRYSPVFRYGFIIEDTDELAERLGAKEKNTFDLRRDSFQHYQHDVFVFFQYMIGNTDWKIHALHNTKLIQNKSTKEFFVIPYDFDYSGFVNAVYAIPNADLRQGHVKERIYMGACKNPEELEAVRQFYISKKEEIYAEVKQFDFLKKKSRKILYKYLKSFYKTLESKKRFKRSCLRRGIIWD